MTPRRNGRARWWRPVPLLLGAMTLWATLAAPSGATTAVTLADWRMDEPAGASVLVDQGPARIQGRIGSSVRAGTSVQGAVAHRFPTVEPDTSPLDPEHLDLVAHDPRLDPGSGDYAMTVRLRTTRPQGNVVQKGQSSSAGGYMKLDMDDGRIACLFKGSAGTLHVRSPASISDGSWHQVRCVRSAQEVVLMVDSTVVDRRRGPTGTVANDSPVTIAGKSWCNQTSVGCDYYSGDIDRVLLERSSDLSNPTTTGDGSEPAVGHSSTTAVPTGVVATNATTTTAPAVVK